MKKIKLRIEGMHCTSCAINIDFDLEDLNGVKNVKTSYAKEEAEVEFDDESIGINEILKTVEKTGYKAELIK